MLERLKGWWTGAKTILIGPLTNPCPACSSLGCKLNLHVDSEGYREMITLDCPKCGSIKRLYSQKPQPRYEAAFTEAVLGVPTKRPKRFREV